MIRKYGDIDYIERFDEEYPLLLAEIPDPPERLYFKGNPALLKTRCFGVVGTRHPSSYGIWAAKKIGARLGEAGYTVVSGMAMGVDSLGHRGCLEAEGNTIAVLGCGVDICYPNSNRKLYREICEKGLIVSEYEPGAQAMPYTFPQRNRIISGLSESVVIVEAGLKSGSLITAELAAEQGRRVFAVPGNINSVMAIGTNMLIRDGANAIAAVDDLLWDTGMKPEPDSEFAKNLSEDELAVLSVLAKGSEVTPDFVADRLSMPAGKVNGILTVLEMKGMVVFSLGKIFIAK